MDTTKIVFGDVVYDPTSTLPPQDLPAGYFLHIFALEDLLAISTTPDTLVKRTDYLILRAGTFLMLGTLETHWFVEVMDEKGETMTVVSAGPIDGERIEVPMSDHPVG